MGSVMVIFQFTTSIIVISGTFVIYKKMNFILNMKLGFNKDQVIMIQVANTLNGRHEEFKNELKQLADVENATSNNYLPVYGTNRDNNGYWKEGRNKIDKPVYGQHWAADADYISTLGMKLVDGRDFDKKLRSDTASIIINQKMAKEMRFKNPVGERMGNWRMYTVIGEVADVHFEHIR